MAMGGTFCTNPNNDMKLAFITVRDFGWFSPQRMGRIPPRGIIPFCGSKSRGKWSVITGVI
eukprot:scaffold43617_cov64-Attheya_sp.AAC.1